MNPIEEQRRQQEEQQKRFLEEQSRRDQQVQINHDLAAISLNSRIPTFWRDMPKMWFAQFEAILGPQHQGEKVKYDLVLAKLNKEELSQVADLIDDPPAVTPYKTLKERLIALFQESAEAQFHKLVKEMDLGSQRPSQLLSKMKELAKNSGAGGDTVKNLWMARLPAWARAILASSNAETSLEDLAALADKIMDNLRSGEIAAVSTPSTSATSTSSPNHINLELINQVRELSMEVKALRCEVNSIRGRGRSMQRSNRHWNRSRSRSKSKSQSTARRTPQSADWLCNYHYKYRDAAKNCVAPCNWTTRKEN